MSAALAFPVSPRSLGRLAGRSGARFDACPFHPASAEFREWSDGWGEATGSPRTWKDWVEYLLAEVDRLRETLVEIRDSAPPDIREKAQHALPPGC